MSERIYNCLVLNDYPDKHYATWVAEKKKTLETRMKQFHYRGDLVICCGNKSVTANAGKALCMVELYHVRPMTVDDEAAACIETSPGRMVYLFKNWRYFNRKFEFARYRVSGSFQSIFQVRLPDDVHIVEQKEIAV